MNFPSKETEGLKKIIQDNDRILLACHLGPDADSIGSNLALYRALSARGKKPEVISSDPLPESMDYLPDYKRIGIKDITGIDQNDFDLFLSVDSGAWQMITKKMTRENWIKKVAVIDHHPSATMFGDMNLVKPDVSSTAEVLYALFRDFNWPVDEATALCFLTGVFSDTGGFSFPGTSKNTFVTVSELMDAGASLDQVVFNLNRRVTLPTMKYWSLVLNNMRMNQELHYAWSIVSKEEIKKLGIDQKGTGGAASMFLGNIEGTEFAFLLTQEDDGQISGSFRSRIKVDSSVFSKALGGGGHLAASGFMLPAKYSLAEAEKLVHETIKKHYNEIK